MSRSSVTLHRGLFQINYRYRQAIDTLVLISKKKKNLPPFSPGNQLRMHVDSKKTNKNKKKKRKFF